MSTTTKSPPPYSSEQQYPQQQTNTPVAGNPVQAQPIYMQPVQQQQPGIVYMAQPQLQPQLQPQPQPQPGIIYMQPQPQPQHVINMVPAVPAAAPIGHSHYPVVVICPYCRNNVTTIVNETPGNTAYLWSFILFLICFPLMWVPCVMSSCLDKIHTCPSCRNVLAQVKA
ncbi:LITAF-like zinc ribbon domain-containing protein [Rhizophagus diaphanus]|nr:LITAF-like zinc ribbon domain-containing protein [Rhizophagus diaphanus] [Rhizophagus sp. MUCL 43196]